MGLTIETSSLSSTRRTQHPIRTRDTNTPRVAPSGPGSSKRGGQSTFLIDYHRISRSRLECALEMLNCTIVCSPSLSQTQALFVFLFADLSTDLERDPLDDNYSGYLWLPCSCSIVFSLSPVSSLFFLSYAALRSKARALVATNTSSTSGCGDLGMMLGASSRGATTGLTVIRESANQGDPDAAHHPFLSNREATLKTMELVVEISLEYSTTQQTRRPESYPRAGPI